MSERLRHTSFGPAHSKAARNVDYELQVESMYELRELTNRIARANWERDERMATLALSNSLSRHDMATAIGCSKSRVDQILRETTEELRRRKNVDAEQRVGRHMPPREAVR
jgi:DNA-directed RNA polymerase specialized sigma subunit